MLSCRFSRPVASCLLALATALDEDGNRPIASPVGLLDLVRQHRTNEFLRGKQCCVDELLTLTIVRFSLPPQPPSRASRLSLNGSRVAVALTLSHLSLSTEFAWGRDWFGRYRIALPPQDDSVPGVPRSTWEPQEGEAVQYTLCACSNACRIVVLSEVRRSPSTACSVSHRRSLLPRTRTCFAWLRSTAPSRMV